VGEAFKALDATSPIFENPAVRGKVFSLGRFF